MTNPSPQDKRRKLNMIVARQIRQEYCEEGMTPQELAAKYNVTDQNIRMILRNKIWREGVYGRAGRRPGKHYMTHIRRY